MLIRLATIFVEDQDRAKAFYTEILGFTLEADNVYGPGARRLTVVAPDATLDDTCGNIICIHEAG